MKNDKRPQANADDALTPDQRTAKIERIKQFALNKAKRLGHVMGPFDETIPGDGLVRALAAEGRKPATAIASLCERDGCFDMIVIYTSDLIELEVSAGATMYECEPDLEAAEFIKSIRIKVA